MTRQLKFRGQLSPSRYYLFVALLLLAVLFLFMLLVKRQLVSNEEKGPAFTREEGYKRQRRIIDIPAFRGMIRDRNGEVLAISIQMLNYYAKPSELRQQTKQLARLATVLNTDEASLLSRLHHYRNKDYMYLAKMVAPEKSGEIEALKIKGVYSEPAYKRFYPEGEVTAQLLGLTDIDGKGLEGIELAYNEWLFGKPGKRKVVKDASGNIVDDLGILEPPKVGKDLELTIDLRVQYRAYMALKAAVVQLRADSASALVVNARTGEILAMVNQPSFNPNNRRQLNKNAVRNRAVTDMFEPGSAVKPFTLIAALENGKVQVDDLIDTSPGWIKIGGKLLHDPRNYGVISLTELLKRSSQVGTVKLAQSLKPEQLIGTLQHFGVGSTSGLGFPREVAGGVTDRAYWSPLDRAALAFGHGLTVNTLQLARAYTILANNGRQVQLKIINNNEEPATVDETTEIPSAIDVRRMLVAVTSLGGTGSKAAIHGHSVAGKSGTIHKVDKRGYDKHSYIAIFAGMAPADKPRVVTVVIINNPKGDSYSGGEVAAPIFAEITKAALQYLKVAPLNAVATRRH